LSWTNEKYVDLHKSDIHGQKGGFARRFIPADTLLGIFTGDVYVVPIKDDGTMDLENCNLEFNDMLQICRLENNIVCLGDPIIGENRTGLSGIDYFNHSCRPNCVVRSSVQMLSLTDIEKGTELLYDYSKVDIIPEGIECWCDTDSKCIF
jgi:hypothetical protein